MPKAKNVSKDTNAQRGLFALIIQIVLLIAAILVYFYFTTQSWVVNCDKDEAGMVNCSVRSTVLGFLTLSEQNVTGMAAAAVDEQCQGASCKYRLELYDNQGVAHPVEEQYTADNIVKERVAKLLNEFVVQPNRKNIDMHEGSNWLIFTLPVTAIIAFVLYRLSLAKPK
jgi:hypothetical protein